MRRSGSLSLIVIVVIAVGWLTYTLTLGGRAPQLGLDLQGGTSVVLAPREKATGAQLDQSISIIRRRQIDPALLAEVMDWRGPRSSRARDRIHETFGVGRPADHGPRPAGVLDEEDQIAHRRQRIRLGLQVAARSGLGGTREDVRRAEPPAAAGVPGLVFGVAERRQQPAKRRDGAVEVVDP